MNSNQKHSYRTLASVLLSVLTVSCICASLFFYFNGLGSSPLFDSRIRGEEQFIKKYIEKHDPDLHQERILATSYWLRYEDVKKDRYWGKGGPLGIWGARDHFLQHGRREGRIFDKVHQPDDMALEQKLAASYWRRYPAIEKNGIWGRMSPLGILGPRDHYRYRGRFEGKIWGLDQPTGAPDPSQEPEINVQQKIQSQDN